MHSSEASAPPLSSPSAVSSLNIPNRLSQLSMSDLRGIKEFIGLGEAKPYQFPDQKITKARFLGNIHYYFGNYIIVNVLALLIIVIMNPSFLVAIFATVGMIFYISRIDGTNVTFGNGVSVTKPQVYMFIVGLMNLMVFFVYGVIIFTMIGASILTISAHAILRTYPEPPEQFNDIDAEMALVKNGEANVVMDDDSNKQISI